MREAGAPNMDTKRLHKDWLRAHVSRLATRATLVPIAASERIRIAAGGSYLPLGALNSIKAPEYASGDGSRIAILGSRDHAASKIRVICIHFVANQIAPINTQ